ncbi:hypothetical protein L1049_001346 [Liquidambar formosana]|uniref:Uncharacterized protein n=1 Tax=Liquidambar formosana TaxID=63359 RepID=A0AAP0ND53_LIQFO
MSILQTITAPAIPYSSQPLETTPPISFEEPSCSSFMLLKEKSDGFIKKLPKWAKDCSHCDAHLFSHISSFHISWVTVFEREWKLEAKKIGVGFKATSVCQQVHELQTLHGCFSHSSPP